MIRGKAEVLGEIVEGQSVAVEVIEGRDELGVFVSAKEVQHMLELIGDIEIIVLGKIDEFADALFEQDINLLVERSTISDPIERQKYDLVGVEIFQEKILVCSGTRVEQDPDFGAQRSERKAEGTQAGLGETKFVFAIGQAFG